jgi:LPXTG-motif cell wall-anchored protein
MVVISQVNGSRLVTRTGSNGAIVTETNVSVSSAGGGGGGGSSGNREFRCVLTGRELMTSETGAIAGGVVGGVLGLALIAGLLFFFLRKRRRSLRDDFDDGMVGYLTH